MCLKGNMGGGPPPPMLHVGTRRHKRVETSAGARTACRLQAGPALFTATWWRHVLCVLLNDACVDLI
jgi:hypothetical protein